MIEKVARGIAGDRYDHPDTEPDDRRAYRNLAEFALDAMRKPTPGMITAANNFCSRPADDIFGEALIKYIINIAINEGYDHAND
jgi:hypothetical protein